MTKPKGYSLHIALNAVDPAIYGSAAMLTACEYDAEAYYEIASQQGFECSEKLYGKTATMERFLELTRQFAQELDSGDYFLLTFSGHGGQVPDLDGDEESGGYDQTWCFYNGQLTDDRLFQLWPEFKAGVRILVVSDSCFSGDILRDIFNQNPFQQTVAQPDFHDVVSRDLAVNPFAKPSIKARVRLLSAAEADKKAEDGKTNGLFTSALLKVWNRGHFQGSFDDFFEAIGKQMPKRKPPATLAIGTPIPSFDLGRPFTI